jgi:putative transposase
MGFLKAVFLFLRAWFASKSNLAAENLALRQQLAVMNQSVKRPKLRHRDRVFWTWLMRLWPNWRSALLIVKPETVIRWHREGFRRFWHRKSQVRKLGRPAVEPEVRDLIQRMSKENPTWGAPRIQSELALLGHDLAESTVAKYMIRTRKPPSQTWRTFLDNHVGDLVGVDFFTVPTATFHVLYCFIILAHDRRRVILCLPKTPSALVLQDIGRLRSEAVGSRIDGFHGSQTVHRWDS